MGQKTSGAFFTHVFRASFHVMVAAAAPAFARRLDRHGRARMSRRGSVGEQAVATAKYPGGFFLALPGLGPLCHQIMFVCCSILSGSRQAPGWPHLLRRSPSAGCAMAPHLTPDELDMITDGRSGHLRRLVEASRRREGSCTEGMGDPSRDGWRDPQAGEGGDAWYEAQAHGCAGAAALRQAF